jgi:hypothetical protein
VIEEKFVFELPKNTKFFAAHYKVELFKMFGSGTFGDEVGLVDIDTVMTSSIAFPAFEPGTLLAYDITAQILPEFGAPRVRADLERVAGQAIKSCRWFGGEFLFGHASTFKKLANAISQIWPRYLDHIQTLHHTSDETLISTVLAQGELDVLDAGSKGLIARWWTARTGYLQQPFSEIKRRNILHLPSDKPFLANFAQNSFDPASLLAAFERHATLKLFARRIFNSVSRTLRGERKFVGNLT